MQSEGQLPREFRSQIERPNLTGIVMLSGRERIYGVSFTGTARKWIS